MADSSVIRTNKPFFVPHFAKEFTGRAAIVMRLCRLGKHIAPRFAHRYCDALAPAIKVSAHSIESPQHDAEHSALAYSFDGALLMGDFTAIDPSKGVNNSQVIATINGIDSKGCLSDWGIDYSNLISQLSVYFTLKMGDLIVVEIGDKEKILSPGDIANANLNGERLLTIRVK